MSQISFEVGFPIIQKEAIDVLINYLKNGISDKIFDSNKYIQVYTLAYKLCTQRNTHDTEKIYEELKVIVTNFTKENIKILTESKDLLRDFEQCYIKFQIFNKWLSKFFTYIDRFYTLHNKILTLNDSNINIFGTILMSDIISLRITNKINYEINERRQNREVCDVLLKKCISIYRYIDILNKNIYRIHFEEKFLLESGLYFKRKALELENLSMTEYLQEIDILLINEVYLVEVLSTKEESNKESNKEDSKKQKKQEEEQISTSKKLELLMVDILIRDQGPELLQKEGTGFAALLQNEKYDDLDLVYKMFSKVPEKKGLELITKIFQKYVEKDGLTKMSDFHQNHEKKSETNIIKELIDLYTKYNNIVKKQLQNDPIFQRSLKMAFENIMSYEIPDDNKQIVELLALYTDTIMKTSIPESELELILENVCNMFKFLIDKDIFEKIYTNLLSKRLLSQKSTSEDAERIMISLLKMTSGASFTSKMEGQLSDLALCRDNSIKFDKYLSQQKSIKTEYVFECSTLSTAYWPTFKNVMPILPDLFKDSMKIYEEYYKKETDHRILTWSFGKGSVLIKATYGSEKTYEIQLSTLQAIALLYISGMTLHASFNDINKVLGSDIEVTKRVLHSISCQPKLDIIEKISVDGQKSSKITVSDTFTTNKNFVSKIRKFRISMPDLDIETHSKAKVEDDRGMCIEAAIVRIMKTRKRLSYTNLISEVITQLCMFKPSPKTIKHRIELLVDKEYLERDIEDHSFFKYLA